LWLVILVLSAFVFHAILEWIFHIQMTKDRTHTYGWANYKKFRHQFDKRKWVFNEDYGLYSNKDNSCYYFAHLNVIKFDDKGMLIHNPVSYWLTRFYVRSYIKQNNLYKKTKGNVVKW
jgi:hypothetical protein